MLSLLASVLSLVCSKLPWLARYGSAGGLVGSGALSSISGASHAHQDAAAVGDWASFWRWLCSGW